MGVDRQKSGPAWTAAVFGGTLRLFLVALVTALLLRMLVIEGFRIPSASMERSLLPGDLVLVSKVHYGPRLPRRIDVPLTNGYVPGLRLPPLRLPGFADVQRGDVIVFHRPLIPPARESALYIKRVVGLPGDTVTVENGKAFVNGKLLPVLPSVQLRWVARLREATDVSLDTLRSLGAVQVARLGTRRHVFEGTEAVAARVRALPGVRTVVPYQDSEGRRYGPVYVPARGDTLREDRLPHPAYAALRRAAEQDARPIRREEPASWVVQEDQFFVMGDNRPSSVDSRSWGLVPADHIVGKAVLVYASWNPADGRPHWSRWFTPVR